MVSFCCKVPKNWFHSQAIIPNTENASGQGHGSKLQDYHTHLLFLIGNFMCRYKNIFEYFYLIIPKFAFYKLYFLFITFLENSQANLYIVIHKDEC